MKGLLVKGYEKTLQGQIHAVNLFPSQDGNLCCISNFTVSIIFIFCDIFELEKCSMFNFLQSETGRPH